MRVLVTGSRDWTDRDAVYWALDQVFDRMRATTDGTEFVVVHGACPTGADRHASEWVKDMQSTENRRGAILGIPIFVDDEPYPITKEQWNTVGRKAGPLRNRHMVDTGVDLCIAFIGPCTSPRCNKPRPHDSHGASGCADYAESSGVTTHRFHGFPTAA